MGRTETISPSRPDKPEADQELYDLDYYGWVRAQSAALRQGDFAAVDARNLADEVGDLGRSQRRAIRNNLNVVLVHLIKWMYQPQKRKPGWEVSIYEHRTRLLDELAESPSLGSYPQEVLVKEYALARRKAAVQMRTALQEIPEDCLMSIDQVLDLDFLPE